ncbi:MAG: twin-arginine translocase subunit TatC [Crocinitomicaceae bacterium]|nr:twin-arginine translocase subunit TatC [Crocinitomicaceae bacterium]
MADRKEEMSFLEHLEELRKRLFRSVLGILVGIIIVVSFDDFVIDKIIMGPRSTEFLTYKVLCALSHQLGRGDQFCFSEMNFALQSTTMGGNFSAYILVCIIGGLILAFPFVIYQLWAFIKPGLNQKEIHSVRGIIFYISLLFFMGVLFGYFVLAPMSIQFLGNFSFSDVQVNSTVLSYLKLTTSLVLGTGLVFQLPVVVYFLAQIGLITADFLRKYRRHAFVVNLIIAAIITPPDVTSQLLVSFPILLLYEVSIRIAARVEKRKAII